MQASTDSYRQPDNRSSASRRLAHLSISDDNHHVTEAIGYMYNDAYDGGLCSGSGSGSGNGSAMMDSKRLSYLSQEENLSTNPINRPGPSSSSSHATANKDRPHLPARSSSINGVNGHASSSRHPLSPHDNPHSPTFNHTAADGSVSFPLTDIDCQSDPATVAQELSNLAALRRMSMDVGSMDPDFPAFGGLMPSIAPSPSADEDDASRLFWVPAHLHPGLAPKEFKSFLDSKADQIKRRSGEEAPVEGPAILQRQGSANSLRRKKSMLSRQVDSSSIGREDSTRSIKVPNLEALSEEPLRQFRGFGDEDVPILPPAPPGHSLRRSRRTTYRKGSLKAGERVPHSRRAARQSDISQSGDVGDSMDTKRSSTPTDEPPILGLTRVSTDPTGYDFNSTNYSRPARTKPVSLPPSANDKPDHQPSSVRTSSAPHTQPWMPPAHDITPVSHSQSSSKPPPQSQPQPQPQSKPVEPPRSDSLRSTTTSSATQPQPHIPERNSSHHPPPSLPQQAPLPPEPTSRASKRAGLVISNQDSPQASESAPKIAAQATPNALLSERRKSDEKEKDKRSKSKKEPEVVRKSGWHWRRGASEEKEKEKEKKKEDDSRRKSSKTYTKNEKPHDNARLDLLQTSIDGPTPARSKERESLVLDRSELVDEEIRPSRKENLRKSSSPPPKKEKEPSLFSSIFGGGKKKIGPHDSHSRKHSRSRARSPSPEYKYFNLKADVDYNWTRFSIMEERAIYRMAHLKLANPRRALYSQVLLSNFMYSYLAKVQQMHPHMALPTSPAQNQAKKKEMQRNQNQSQQRADDYSQYQQSHDQDSFSGTSDSQMYEYDFDDGYEQSQHSAESNRGYERHPEGRTEEHAGMW